MQGSPQQPQDKQLLPRAGGGHSCWQGSSQGCPKPPSFAQRPCISMLCSCSTLLRELLTGSHGCGGIACLYMSFARFEIISVKSKSLTCKATIPEQLLGQTSPSGSSQAALAPGRISCLSRSVFHMFICHSNAHPDPCCSTEAGLALLYMPTIREKKENQNKINAKNQIITGFSQSNSFYAAHE